LDTGVEPLSGDVKVELKSAQSTEVSVTTWRTDRLKELPFENWASSAESGKYGEDLDNANRYVATECVRVEGMTATLTFSNDRSAALKAKYQGNTPPLGAHLNAKWTDDGRLVISSTQAFYVVAELSLVEKGRSLGMHPNGQRVKVLKPKQCSATTRSDRDDSIAP